ncbi:MAG: hypothetical protein AAFX07_11675 [Pseudomonadota bacterium]
MVEEVINAEAMSPAEETPSTAELGVSDVYSLESDKGRSEKLKVALDGDIPDYGWALHHADIGPTGTCGRATEKIVAPLSFAGRMAKFEGVLTAIPANLLTQIGAFVDQR